MIDAIEALLKHSKPNDEFALNFQEMRYIADSLKELKLLKEKYNLLLTQIKQ